MFQIISNNMSADHGIESIVLIRQGGGKPVDDPDIVYFFPPDPVPQVCAHPFAWIAGIDAFCFLRGRECQPPGSRPHVQHRPIRIL